ncbi:putative succinyl-diaminopimelate desuccinylase OS=Streptomyces paromomycinus OX=92743 GN=GKJPGBOP_07429 PE=4 SV=1 [Streptomyces rimosus subsp. rimosus]
MDPHQKDEYVEVREIGEYARVYAAAARHFLAGSGTRPEGAAA